LGSEYAHRLPKFPAFVLAKIASCFGEVSFKLNYYSRAKKTLDDFYAFLGQLINF